MVNLLGVFRCAGCTYSESGIGSDEGGRPTQLPLTGEPDSRGAYAGGFWALFYACASKSGGHYLRAGQLAGSARGPWLSLVSLVQDRCRGMFMRILASPSCRPAVTLRVVVGAASGRGVLVYRVAAHTSPPLALLRSSSQAV